MHMLRFFLILMLLSECATEQQKLDSEAMFANEYNVWPSFDVWTLSAEYHDGLVSDHFFI